MDKIPKGVIVIGLDGATLDVLIPLAKQGLMPRMGELLKKSAYGPLTSVIPPVTGPAWTTFMTGMMPDRHGLMDFVHRTEGSVHRVPVNYNRIQTPTILENAFAVSTYPLPTPLRKSTGLLSAAC